MNPLTPELSKAPLAPPMPRTGVLSKEVEHFTGNDERELESVMKWGYYALAGEVSLNTNPHTAGFKPYYIRYYPFVEVRRRSHGEHANVIYRACAVVAYTSAEDCGVGDFYKRFEIVREHTLYLPLSGDKVMRFEKKVYRLVTPDDYEEIELWERVS